MNKNMAKDLCAALAIAIGILIGMTIFDQFIKPMVSTEVECQ
jgi:hypothetical protein